MISGTSAATADLPETVHTTLDTVCSVARQALGDSLHAIVLYGSAAEGRLRRTSDVNVLFVLASFDPHAIDALHEPLQTAAAAIALRPMFILKDEIPAAAAAFAVKFDDIARRRRILYGADPFTNLSVPRERLVARLQQVLLNLTLRLRARYAVRSDFDDQVVAAVADAAGPLRASAAALLALEGQRASAPKAALEAFVRSLNDPALTEAVARISEAREQRTLPPGVATPTLAALVRIADAMKTRALRPS
jgi:predicted nucleotidyltransferase